MVPFPSFNEKTFPLILIKEKAQIVIFNTQLKEYIKVVDIQDAFGTSLCFLDKELNGYAFITECKQ